MIKFLGLILVGIALSGCTIPFTDIVIFEDDVIVEKDCTLEPCEESQMIESDLSVAELLPKSIVGVNEADLPVLEQCEVDENVFVDCYPKVTHQLVVFQENYALVIPTSLIPDTNVLHELKCIPSQQGLSKADFVPSAADFLRPSDELSEACYEKAPVDWCCEYIGVK